MAQLCRKTDEATLNRRRGVLRWRRKQLQRKGVLESRRGRFRHQALQTLFLQGREWLSLCGEEPHLQSSLRCGVWAAMAGVWLQAAGTVQMQNGRLGR